MELPRNLPPPPEFDQHVKSIIFPIVLSCGLSVTLPAQTSENNARLKAALERFPAGDANKDGVLTVDEARAFLKEKNSGAETAGTEKTKAAGADKKIDYKDLDDRKLVLHAFEPENHQKDARVPAIVFFHGGGWANGNPQQFAAQSR